jgi:hypothetical protein
MAFHASGRSKSGVAPKGKRNEAIVRRIRPRPPLRIKGRSDDPAKAHHEVVSIEHAPAIFAEYVNLSAFALLRHLLVAGAPNIALSQMRKPHDNGDVPGPHWKLQGSLPDLFAFA